MTGESLLIPIPWETRNLGRPSFEVSPDRFQDLEADRLRRDLKALADTHPSFFVQCRLPKEHLPRARHLEGCGFYFIETTLEPHVVLDRNGALQTFKDDPASFLPKRLQGQDLSVSSPSPLLPDQAQSVRTIARETFIDDRFHLDAACGRTMADERFVHWVDDLLADPGVSFDLVLHDGAYVGFMARKKDRLILAGFLKSHVGLGLGEFLWLSTMTRMQEGGVAKIQTLISANNTPVMNLYTRLGYKFKNPASTFHYWGGAAS